MLTNGRHLYSAEDDVYCGMPHTRTYDENYAALCPWAKVWGTEHIMPKELTAIGTELFENEKTREHAKKQTGESG